MALTEKQVSKIFNDVYSGKVTQQKLPKAYYNDFADTLDAKIKKGFGVRKVTERTRNLDAITGMSENARLFAGGKTYHLTRELVDAKKAAKSKKEFKAEAQKIYDKYQTWGQAEADTMLSQAQSCKNWQDIERDKDLFPKLKYSTIGDACVICAPLDGVVAPVDDPFWSTHAPINHYNCLCLLTREISSVRNTNKNKLESLTKQLDPVMDDTFKNNVGITHEAFPRHAYFEVAKKDIPLARRNFDLPIPDIKNSLDLDEFYEQVQVRFNANEFHTGANAHV